MKIEYFQTIYDFLKFAFKIKKLIVKIMYI